MVRAETADAVRRDVRGVREVPEVLGWHSDFPDFIAVRHLPVEFLLRIDQHGNARHRRSWRSAAQDSFPELHHCGVHHDGFHDFPGHQPCGGHLLGSLYVYFRDVAHIWEVVLQAMFYATPIIYPISMVAQNKEFSWAADILMLNPTTQTIMDIRHNLLSPEYVPTVWTMVDNKLLCLLPYVLSAVILWLGIHDRGFDD